jgi:uncharacterized protein YoxC
MVNLETTNWLLGVMAVASAVQTLMLVGVAIVGFRLYRQVRTSVQELESRHVAPLRRQVDGLLTRVDGVVGDVQTIAARVNHRTERVDDAIVDTMGRVDETAEHLKERVRDTVSQATGVVRGIRAVIAAFLTSDAVVKPPAGAGGRP